ncbi:hypothetical protein [Thalassobaculum litoreum]|nr:hypothetical protein [Thalassobaculum litoreum]
MSATPKASSHAIEMPAPYGLAPAPGLRWNPEVDFAARNIRALIDLWKARRPTRRGLPSFRGFDGLELRPWADNLIVLDTEPTLFGGHSYRYRMVGPAASTVEGGNFTGLYLQDALSSAQAAPRVRLYDRALQFRAPVEVRGRVALGGTSPATPGTAPGSAPGTARWDTVALPLSYVGERADHLMVLTYVEALD